MVLERNGITCGFCRCFNLSCKQLFNNFGKVFSASFFIQLTYTHFHQDRMLWCSTNRASLLLSRLNYLDIFLGWYILFLCQVKKAFSFPKVINMKCRLTFSPSSSIFSLFLSESVICGTSRPSNRYRPKFLNVMKKFKIDFYIHIMVVDVILTWNYIGWCVVVSASWVSAAAHSPFQYLSSSNKWPAKCYFGWLLMLMFIFT